MILNDKNSSYFQTSDIGLVTALLIQGVFEHHIDNSNPRRVVFFFEQTDELADILKKYWSGELRVEPQSFWNTFREVKGRTSNEWR